MAKAKEKGAGSAIGSFITIIVIIAIGAVLGYSKYSAGEPARANNKAVEQINAGNPQAALDLLDDTLKRFPGEARLHLNRAVALQDLNRYADAIPSYRQAMTYDAALTDQATQGISECEAMLE